jgi:hypothetical protein
MTPSSKEKTASPAGRVLNSSATEFLCGSTEDQSGPLRIGSFVQVEAGGREPGSSTTVIGVVADIRIVDDAFSRQLVSGEAKAEYIQEQRDRRLTPLEVRVLHAGYIAPEGGGRHRLPPRPPRGLEAVYPCPAETVRAFLRAPQGGWNFAFLTLLTAAEASSDVLVECLWQAAAAQPPDPQNLFLQEAARELTRLLSADLPRLYSLLPKLSA